MCYEPKTFFSWVAWFSFSLDAFKEIEILYFLISKLCVWFEGEGKRQKGNQSVRALRFLSPIEIVCFTKVEYRSFVNSVCTTSHTKLQENKKKERSKRRIH